MSHHHLSAKSCSGAAQRSRPLRRGAHYSHARRQSQARQRARIIARLLGASRALPVDPVAAALLLDGALNLIVDYWTSRAGPRIASVAEALKASEAHAPAVAWRLRLALQAPIPEARLAHAWALVDLLTGPTATTTSSARIAPSLAHEAPVPNHHQSHSRKDDQSHVS